MAAPGSNNVVPQGADYVFAFHDVLVDLTGLYDQPVTITMPDGSEQTIPPPDVVFAPRDFIYAYDAWGRRLDPRRFAGPGGTPLGPGAVRQGAPAEASAAPARPQPQRDWSTVPGLPETPDPVPPMPLPEPPPPEPEPAPTAEPTA